MKPDRLLIDGCEINNWDGETIDELRRGGVDAVQATCAVWEDARGALGRLLDWQDRFERHADVLVPARSVAEIEAAHHDGRIAVLLGFQNTAPIEDDPRLLQAFRTLGIRVIQLTYNSQNAVGGSCFEPCDSGLSRFGHTVVSEMNRLGLLIDCSHVGDRTTREAIDASSAPIAITHANPRWFCDHPRNKPDDVLAALAARGGVVGVTLYPPFIGGADVRLEDFASMVARLVEQLGPEHVAIGTDLARNWSDADLVALRHGRQLRNPPLASWPRWPAWFCSAADLPHVIEGLAERGLDAGTIDKVAAGNWMRLYDDVFPRHAHPTDVERDDAAHLDTAAR
jgi:membrane dipeptidase